MNGKIVFLLNENKDRTILPRLSRDKDKEKWQKIFGKAELFVQKLWTPIHWRPCIGLQRLSFLCGKTHIIDDSSRNWN
jgi:hypothetical protein